MLIGAKWAADELRWFSSSVSPDTLTHSFFISSSLPCLFLLNIFMLHVICLHLMSIFSSFVPSSHVIYRPVYHSNIKKF